MTDNYHRIIRKEILDIVKTLEGKSRLVVLKEGCHNESHVVRPLTEPVVEDVSNGLAVKSECNGLHLHLLVEGECYAFYEFLFIVVE